jgi:superfamily II DNA or RNA helicase
MEDKRIQRLKELQLEAEQAHLSFNKRSSICLSVGSGKSWVAMNRLKNYSKTANVVFAGAREIYNENFKSELIKNNMGEWIDIIHFCCSPSLKNYNKTCDFFIADESHLSPMLWGKFAHDQLELNKDIEILALTGTPINGKSEEGKYIYSICPISYSKVIDDNITENNLNDYKIHVIYHDLDRRKNIPTSKPGFLTSERSKYDWLYNKYTNNKDKLSFTNNGFSYELMQIKQFFNNLNSKKEVTKQLINELNYNKLLIYAGCIEQAESFNLPTYHSGLSKEVKKANYDAFYSDDSNILINVNGIKESVSIPNLDAGLIMKVDASDKGFSQILGRLLRLLPKETADLYVLVAKDTIEEEWIVKACSKLDNNKIDYTYI